MVEGTRFRSRVFLKYLAEAALVCFICRFNFPRQRSTVLLSQAGHSKFANRRNQRGGDIQGTYRDALLASVTKNRSIQTIIVTPALVVFRSAKKFLFRNSSGNI